MKSTSKRSISLHKNDKAKRDKINKHRDSIHYRERIIHRNTNRLQFLFSINCNYRFFERIWNVSDADCIKLQITANKNLENR